MMFKIGIISDTHGLLRPEAERRLAGVDHIVHAGDIGRPEIVDALRRIAPVTAIRGNVDNDEWAREYPDTKLVRLAGKSIYVLHDLKTLQVDPGAGIDVIVSGHSHVPKIDTIGGVLYLNPGSAGRRRFKLPITLATLEVTPEGIRSEIHDLAGCATLTIDRGGRIRPMARKLKTYQTSLGFFDLAIAAPSMKAALEAWGADSNLFHQGAARESDDPDVIAAAMAKPGIVLRRPVGSAGSFGEHAELPTDLGGPRPTKAARKSKGRTAKQPSSRPIDKAAERKAALAFEKEQKRRERERASEEAARQKDRERRQQAVDKAQAALNKAEQEHAKRAATIQTEVEALEKRSQAEEARWDKEKGRLEAALRRARG